MSDNKQIESKKSVGSITVKSNKKIKKEYPEELVSQVLEMRKNGVMRKFIMKKLNISYYHLRKIYGLFPDTKPNL